jgi:hypothetical protein
MQELGNREVGRVCFEKKQEIVSYKCPDVRSASGIVLPGCSKQFEPEIPLLLKDISQYIK